MKRAKQQATDQSGYDSMPDLNTSESDPDPLPGNVDDDPEFSDGDSSSDEAEPVPDNGATVASVQQPARRGSDGAMPVDFMMTQLKKSVVRFLERSVSARHDDKQNCSVLEPTPADRNAHKAL